MNPAWSRRPDVGTPPKTFQSTLPAADVVRRLKALTDGRDTTGKTEGAGAATMGFVVSGSWPSGHMPAAAKEKITSIAPVFLAALALMALAYDGFRRWRQGGRDRVFDKTIVALEGPIE